MSGTFPHNSCINLFKSRGQTFRKSTCLISSERITNQFWLSIGVIENMSGTYSPKLTPFYFYKYFGQMLWNNTHSNFFWKDNKRILIEYQCDRKFVRHFTYSPKFTPICFYKYFGQIFSNNTKSNFFWKDNKPISIEYQCDRKYVRYIFTEIDTF